MIIDAHAHLYTKPRDLDRVVNSGLIEQVWIMNIYYANQPNKQFATQKEILEVAKEYKGFFIPFGYLDFSKKPDIVERLYEKGFVGLKAIRPTKPYDDPSYFPYYEKAEKLKMPILFHTGDIAKATQKEAGEGLSLGPTNVHAAMLQAIAAALPNLTLIGGHLGWPWLEETVCNLYYYPNIYHDISGTNPIYFIPWLFNNIHHTSVGRENEGIVGDFSDKLLMATDSYYGRRETHGHVLESIKFWEFFFKKYSGPYWWGKDSDKNAEKILRGNAKKILKRYSRSK